MAHPSWHPMNARNPSKTSFPSMFRESVPQSSQASLPSHRFHEHYGRYPKHKTNDRNINSVEKQLQNKNSKNLMSLLQWYTDWFIQRIFSSYPLWIQSIMTAIIGFISYFLYDLAIGLESLSSYIMYKLLSFLGFLTSVFFVYVVLNNITNNKKNKSSELNEANDLNPSLNALNNPYSQHANKARPQEKQQQQSSSYLQAKGNDLYFTQKSMSNRVSSQVLNRENENKLDYNSSPQKIESLDPTQIATHKNLNKFLAKQRKKEDIYGTPINNATPIGKTFGSMRMTPATSAAASHLNTWNSINSFKSQQTNQGSAVLYTPNSSVMDVTMISYQNELNLNNEEPFNVDFSVIEPKQSFGSWNGAKIGSKMVDLSMMAQPGTPAKNILLNNTNNANYVYDGMYSDINLRGDNIGNVKQQIYQQQQQQADGHKSNINAVRVSPFSRKRRSVIDTNNNQQSHNLGNDFSAYYMEKAVGLYRSLRIDGLIENWAESMRWWLSQNVLKMRNNELITNENDINNEIFSLLCNKYNLKQQLSELRTTSQKEVFIISNEGQLMNVAQQVNKPSIMHIIQKRKHLKDCIDFICSNYNDNNNNANNNNSNNNNSNNNNNVVHEYVYQRIATLSSTNNLTLYNWNGGTDKKWRYGAYPSDAELVMKLFCRYMDDIMCPAIKFSQKHYFEIPRMPFKKVGKFLNKNALVKDIAIICVKDCENRNNFNNRMSSNNDSAAAAACLPYFFIAFDKKKFGNKIKHFGGFNPVSSMSAAANQKSSFIQKPRHYLFGQTNEEKELEIADHENKNKNNNSDSACATWFPQPGKMNVIHTITLFALFIHRYCNDKLTGIALKDQACTLLQPIFK